MDFGALENSRFRNLVGEFQIGPLVNTSAALQCIKTYLALKDEKFYKLKVLEFDPDEKPTKDVVQGKVMLHNEYVLLDILKDIGCVEKCHGIFIESLKNERSSSPARPQKRITLVLDASGDASWNWMNINLENYNISLQEYIKNIKLTEREALLVFYDIVLIVEQVHQRNIIHRDLKLQNFLINTRTKKITLTNFSLGKLLTMEDELILDQRGFNPSGDQRGSLYISPEILNNGNPYKGKASDIWPLGVILYILIYSSFPFVESTTVALFKKISQCELVMPTDVRVSEATRKLIKNHLLTTSIDRFTATEIRMHIERQFSRINKASMMTKSFDQVVPTHPDIDRKFSQVKLISQDLPKFELSTENMSSVLKMTSPTTQHEQNKMFLKPSLLAERCNRISVSPSNGVTRNLTRQINNLSVRNRQHSNSGLSWHNRISNTSLYEVRFRAAESTILNDRARLQQRGSSATTSFDAIYNTLNELFSSGNFPANAIVHEFQGSINQDIALKLSIWLRTNFPDNSLVREIYDGQASDVEKFVEFLKRCNVQMEGIVVKAQQSNQTLIFLTFLLTLSGYNNNYFLNISRGS